MDNDIIGIQDVLGRLQGDKELLLELIQIFLEDAPQRFHDVSDLIKKEDCVQLADAAHSVKGAASNIGANKLWHSFKTLEQAAKDKDLALASAIFARASAEFEEFKEYIPCLRSQLAAL